MIKLVRFSFAMIALLALLSATLFQASAQSGTVVVTAQILDYEKGYVFFTTGDGFRVASNALIWDYKTGAPTDRTPEARDYARVTFDASGTVIKIELSRAKVPPEGDLAAVRRFAIALSTPAPNPDLVPRPAGGHCTTVRPGKSVTVSITVEVPPTTPLTDAIYMTTDQSGWAPQAYRLDRRDALHYRMQLKLLSGTVLHVLFDRGSTQSMQLGENGIEQQPYLICIGDEDAQSFTATVHLWGDQQIGGSLSIPQGLPTPYNPKPFPNLPTPPPTPLP